MTQSYSISLFSSQLNLTQLYSTKPNPIQLSLIYMLFFCIVTYLEDISNEEHSMHFRQKNPPSFPTWLQAWHGVDEEEVLSVLCRQRNASRFVRHWAQQSSVVERFKSNVSVSRKKNGEWIHCNCNIFVEQLLLCQN